MKNDKKEQSASVKELSNEHLYLISEIIDRMDIKLPESTINTNGEEAPKNRLDYAKELALSLIRSAYKAKDVINQLLADLYGKKPEEIKAMSGVETLNALSSLFGKEEFTDFFK